MVIITLYVAGAPTTAPPSRCRVQDTQIHHGIVDTDFRWYFVVITVGSHIRPVAVAAAELIEAAGEVGFCQGKLVEAKVKGGRAPWRGRKLAKAAYRAVCLGMGKEGKSEDSKERGDVGTRVEKHGLGTRL